MHPLRQRSVATLEGLHWTLAHVTALQRLSLLQGPMDNPELVAYTHWVCCITIRSNQSIAQKGGRHSPTRRGTMPHSYAHATFQIMEERRGYTVAALPTVHVCY